MATDKQQHKEEKATLLKCALPVKTILRSGSREYKVVEVLGAGGFGITYKVTANFQVGNVTVANFFVIKEHFLKGCWRADNKTDVLHAPTMETDVKQSRKDFIEEAHRLNKLGKISPNIVKVNEVFEANGTAYYVMEYLDGGDLLQYVRKNGAMSENKAVRMIMVIAKAVELLHTNRLLHLDIKPDNIVLKTDESTGATIPVLIDFGIAKHFDKSGNPTSHLTAKGASEGYAPIEQYTEINHFAPEIDVYALGATLYYLVTGKNPPQAFDIHTFNDIKGNLPPSLDDTTVKALKDAMKPNKFERTPSVNAFIKSFAESYTLPVGYVLRSNHIRYTITEVVDENAYSIIYKAVPTDSVNGSGNTHPLGNATTVKTTYIVHELFCKEEGDKRKEDGTVVHASQSSAHSNAAALAHLQEDAEKNIPNEFLNKTDVQGYVKAEKFRTNGTYYYCYQRVKPSPVWKKVLLTVCKAIFAVIDVASKYKKQIFVAIAVFAIAFGTYRLLPYLSRNTTKEPVQPVVVNDSTANDSTTSDSTMQPKKEEKDTAGQSTITPPTPDHKPTKNESEKSEDKLTPVKKQVETDDQKYSKAIASNDKSTLKALASKGYAKAYSKVASIYVKENNYSAADAYARRALRANVGRSEAINVVEILDGYGYYDNGEHGGKPKY